MIQNYPESLNVSLEVRYVEQSLSVLLRFREGISALDEEVHHDVQVVVVAVWKREAVS